MKFRNMRGEKLSLDGILRLTFSRGKDPSTSKFQLVLENDEIEKLVFYDDDGEEVWMVEK